jgi:hypothetical protein
MSSGYLMEIIYHSYPLNVANDVSLLMEVAANALNGGTVTDPSRREMISTNIKRD